MAGQPKKFKSEDDLKELYFEFIEDVIENDYNRAPSKLQFSRWLRDVKGFQVDLKTIYTSFNEYFPTIKKDFQQIYADVLSEGVLLGKQNTTMAIFMLKNQAGWSDQPKQEDNSAEKLDAILLAIKEDK
ncbi:MAG: hypothetical protein ACRC1D_03645 [Culicoidibacterales bacterium]